MGVVGTVKEALFLVWVLPVCVDLLRACSDLVVIRYIHCVGRSSTLIAIPLSLVVCMSYTNRPGAT